MTRAHYAAQCRHCHHSQAQHPCECGCEFEGLEYGVDYDQHKEPPHALYSLCYLLSEGDVTKHDVILETPIYLAYQYAETKIVQANEQAEAYKTE